MNDIKPIKVSINEDTNGTTESKKRDFQRLEMYIQELADEDIIRSRKSCLI